MAALTFIFQNYFFDFSEKIRKKDLLFLIAYVIIVSIIAHNTNDIITKGAELF